MPTTSKRIRIEFGKGGIVTHVRAENWSQFAIELGRHLEAFDFEHWDRTEIHIIPETDDAP